MKKNEQTRWTRQHSQKCEAVRSSCPGGKVYNRHYGDGTLVDEWGVFLDVKNRHSLISGRGVFDVRFKEGICPINADNLVLL
jgi:hypothetical protein